MRPPRAGRKAGVAHAEFLDGLLDSTSLVVYLKDLEGRYLYVNRRYELLSGASRAVILGRRDHDLFPKEVADLFREQDGLVASRGKAVEFEETIPLPGGVRSFITEKFPLLDKKGKVYATGGFCTEITSQKNRADESLAEQRERMAVTVRGIATGIVAVDAGGRVVMLNPAAEALAGMSDADARGRAVDEILRTVDAAASGLFGRLLREALSPSGASAPPRDAAVLLPSGERRLVVPAASAVRDRRGRITGAVLSLRDVTEQRRTDEELFKVRSLESLGFLAGGIAHDFNNLVAGVMGNLELLGHEIGADGDARELLDDARKICAKAAALADRLMTFAEGGEPVRRTFALGPLLRDAPRLVLHGSGVRSEVHAPPALWTVHGDETQISQILGNLLVNAREAMPAGGTVAIRAENHALAEPTVDLKPGRYVRITVRDDGPGIPAAILTRIFDPYFSSKKRGSGLGLSIVHSVVRRHGGHVWAESVEGEGALFTVLLPASGKKPSRRAAKRRPGA